ncbi:hypothetical protein [Burkholderia gladioli]|uniref:hypothetical protein n=1 Tax=Burkholderia gladioli TaxID=28095 RepID=UPI003D1E8CC6
MGSIAKYDGGLQKLSLGKFVAGGLRLRFLLNGQHDMRTISTAMFSVFGDGLRNAPPPQYADTVIHNDVWIGDEALFLGGSVVESGCVIGARAVIPPNFRAEPYGVYVGSPAKLVRFRFPERGAREPARTGLVGHAAVVDQAAQRSLPRGPDERRGQGAGDPRRAQTGEVQRAEPGLSRRQADEGMPAFALVTSARSPAAALAGGGRMRAVVPQPAADVAGSSA